MVKFNCSICEGVSMQDSMLNDRLLAIVYHYGFKDSFTVKPNMTGGIMFFPNDGFLSSAVMELLSDEFYSFYYDRSWFYLFDKV